MNKNKNLHTAKSAKNDEFYTCYEDIEKELIHYKDKLNNMWVYCPCDGEESKFWQYFKDNYNILGLRHLTASKHNKNGNGIRLDYDGTNITKTVLNGNGDFRSEECTKIMKDCDIVITNPPFSLFREFIQWLRYDED